MNSKYIAVDDTQGTDIYINTNLILGFIRFPDQNYTVIYTMGNSKDAPFKFYTSLTPDQLLQRIDNPD